MAVPKRKVSRKRRDQGFASNTKIKPGCVSVCQTCQAAVLPHQLCKECGHYKGIKVLRTKADRMHDRVQTRQTKTEEQKHKTEVAAENKKKEIGK